MKSLAEIIGGAQCLLDISFELREIFEDHLSDEHKTFLHMLRIIEESQPPMIRRYAGTGRKPYEYQPFIRSALAKQYFGIEQTKQLILRLKTDSALRLICGFKRVPGKSSFSRYFGELSEGAIMNDTLDGMVMQAHKNTVVYHVSRDSTAIEAREKAVKKPGMKKEKKRRGRPKKGEIRPEKPIEKQARESPEESLRELDTACSYGCKKNSQGNIYFWRGYKLHLDVSDIGFPLSACVTGANARDSRLAIIMEKMTGRKVSFCYSLMDSAYDSEVIDRFIRSRGRVPIIDPNKRANKERPPLDAAKQERFKFRSVVERANGILKDSLLPAKIYVKGHAKVSFVLMCSVVCLAALRTLQYFIL
jgi:transposase